jgi:phosphoribosylaminoimidazolecarboxamide formyltransferase/IMP cyclohydrolase
VLVAPDYEEAALEVLQEKEAIRILRADERRQADPRDRDAKHVLGGLLIQDRDGEPEPRELMEVVTKRQPDEREWADLCFAWTVVRHVRSNAIVIAKDGATVGIGAGQMSRVDSVRLAVEKCREARGEEADALLAGSAARLRRLLPLRRRPRAGDRSRLDRGDPARRLQTRRRGDRGLRRRGVAMVFTKHRHFRH